MAKKKREGADNVVLSDEQKYLQAQWIYHQRNANADLDATDVGPLLDGIIKFTNSFKSDTTIRNDLREWAEQLHAGAKAVSGYLGSDYEDAFKAGFVLGMIWEQLKFHAGPLAEAVREHSGIVAGSHAGSQTSAETRRGDREEAKKAAAIYLAKGRTDVLDLLQANFGYKKRTAEGILREVQGKKSR